MNSYKVILLYDLCVFPIQKQFKLFQDRIKSLSENIQTSVSNRGHDVACSHAFWHFSVLGIESHTPRLAVSNCKLFILYIYFGYILDGVC